LLHTIVLYLSNNKVVQHQQIQIFVQGFKIWFNPSISNNNHATSHHRQGETSRTHLNENQDEALLFDDPYADGGIAGGLNGSSANPYKSLTLAVT